MNNFYQTLIEEMTKTVEWTFGTNKKRIERLIYAV
jgi:hypothetical protein